LSPVTSWLEKWVVCNGCRFETGYVSGWEITGSWGDGGSFSREFVLIWLIHELELSEGDFESTFTKGGFELASGKEDFELASGLPPITHAFDGYVLGEKDLSALPRIC
jgi:hypothetical protein